MSKTLSIKKEPAVPTYTADQLRAMLAELEPKSPSGVPLDPTMGLSIDSLPAHAVADRSALPPAEERVSAPAPQIPPALHGAHGLNGIRLVAPQVDVNQGINPATGLPYAQVSNGPVKGGQIQIPPSRRFDGR